MIWLDYALPLVKQFEGCKLQAYPDPASGGDPWTIGYGATGQGIEQGTVWTQEQAYNDLWARLTTVYGPGVENAVTALISAQQEAAMVSLAYNIGISAFASSTLVRLLDQGDYHGAADQFLVWNKASGKVMLGLVARRAAERALFLEGTS